MRKFIIHFILFVSLASCQILVYGNETDSIPNDTIQKKVNVVSQVTSETKEMSKYFSVTKILISIIILALTYFFLKIVSALLSVWAERSVKYRITIKGFIPIISILVWLASLTFILVAVFRPPLASILAFAASIGVAVGLAAQDLLKNIFGGIVIIIDKPFQIGDKVQIGNYYGEVMAIGLRSTRVVTPDDSMVTVPNAEVMNHSVSNANTSEENCQVSTELYLPLKAELEEIRQRALEAAQVSKYIFLNKPIVVLFSQESFASKVMMKVKIKAYVNDIRNEFLFKSELTEILTKEFSDYYENETVVDNGEI